MHYKRCLDSNLSYPHIPPTEPEERMQNRRIPQDMVDHVIDFLHGDRKTLCNTSTVSKGCVATSRRHLFHKIKVERLRGVFPFDFLAFVETNPHIAIYVKQLRIQGDLDNDAFPKLLAALPNLSVLSIRDWFSPMRRAAAGPVERKYTLDYLLLDVVTARGYSNYPNKLGRAVFQVEEPTVAGAINGPGGDGPGPLQMRRDPSYIDATRHSGFLSLFSSIQELDLRPMFLNCDWNLTSSELAEIIPDHRRSQLVVKSLTSTHNISDPYFEFFNKILDLSVLEELVLCNRFPSFTKLGTLIQLSTHLRKISFGFGACYETDASAMSLCRPLSLRHLFIQLEPEFVNIKACSKGQSVAVPLFDWPSVQSILNTDLSRLHRLSIQILRPILGDIIQHLESVGWDWLDEKIIVEMSNLECVEFLPETDDPRRTGCSEEQELERLKEYISERLPRTKRKGLIRIGRTIEILKFRNRWINDHDFGPIGESSDY